MNQKDQAVLSKHHLKHIPELRVDKNIFELGFSAECSMMHCNAACCQYGVYADVVERDKILAHQELIQRHLETHQPADPSEWFERDEVVDEDFPSGKAVGTQAKEYGCVFLDSVGRCTLQKAAVAEGMEKFSLKPFFCVAYPITIEHHELKIDQPDFVNRRECCSAVPQATRSIFDICQEEFEHVLGVEGADELRGLATEIET